MTFDRDVRTELHPAEHDSSGTTGAQADEVADSAIPRHTIDMSIVTGS